MSDNSLPILLDYGYGLVFGLVTALSLALFWMTLGGSIQEEFIERFVDPLTRKTQQAEPSSGLSEDPAAALADPRTCAVIISDLHCDFWNRSPNNQSTRFQSFCDAVQSNPGICQVFLNGDLADFPQQGPTESVLSVSLTQHEVPTQPNLGGVSIDMILRVLHRLSHSESRHIAINFILGNHDCGLSGLRTASGNSFVGQLFERVWQPAMEVGDPGQPKVYFEHGHQYDPFLWLYMRFAVLDIVRFSKRNRDLEFIDQNLRSTNADQAIAGSLGSMHCMYAWALRMGYRFAARRLCYRRPFADGPGCVVFGHTHIPDRYTFPNGATYVNSGDWSALSGHATFLVVTTDGHLHGPYEWPEVKSPII